MTKNKILLTSLLALLGAACSSTDSHNPGPAPSAATPTVAHRQTTAGAVQVPGDVVPHRLVAMAIPKPVDLTPIHGSDALAPKKPYQFGSAAEPVRGTELRRTVTANDPSSLTFPIDAPEGALVLVRAVDNTTSLTTVHLRDVATGTRLDRARDDTTMVGHRQNRSPAAHPKGVSTNPPPDGMAKPHPDPFADLAAHEQGFGALMLQSRQLSFDVPTKPGLVQLDLPASVLASGVIVEVRQPSSQIMFTGSPKELNYGFGDTAEVVLNLANGATPVTGATFSGYAELPNHTRSPELTFTENGNGQYTTSLPLATTDWKYVGVWTLHVKTKGVASGLSFERDLDTAFGYYPAHAQMTDISTPELLRGADGLVDEISVDVDVETLAADRLSVRGTLTYIGPDGQEHALAQAQTGQAVDAGKATITLHFTADSLALANIDGPFQVRDVALVSQAFGITQHRIGRGLDLTTGAVRSTELRFPKTISLQAQDLIDNGDLDAVKK